MTELGMRIAVAGWAGSGKGEVARVLMDDFGLPRVKFADPLKNMFRSLLADLGHDAQTIERYIEGDLKASVVAGIDGVEATSRHFMISLGTKWGRQGIHPDLWAKVWAAKAAKLSRFVVDDLRFLNEEHVHHTLGGLTVLVVRPGTEPAAFKWGRFGRLLFRWFGCMWGVHDSERTDRLNPDIIIHNDGTLDQLHAKIHEMVDDLA
jgi:hypothetical protein